MRVHLRRRSAIAAVTALVVVSVGWLSSWHAATTTHAEDGTGALLHTQAIGEHHHDDRTAHVHSTPQHDPHADEACRLLGALHTTVQPIASWASPTPLLPAASAAPPIAVIAVPIARYRLAPKTSPPARLG
jgi:hypothetical protein